MRAAAMRADVADPEDFTGRKGVDIAEVEQDCPAPEAKIDQHPGIGEDVIDQPRLDQPRHGRSLPGRVRDLRGQGNVRSRSGEIPFRCWCPVADWFRPRLPLATAEGEGGRPPCGAA